MQQQISRRDESRATPNARDVVAQSTRTNRRRSARPRYRAAIDSRNAHETNPSRRAIHRRSPACVLLAHYNKELFMSLQRRSEQMNLLIADG